MRWFKHYSSASRSYKLQVLKDECGLEGIGFYWSLVELMSEKLDINDVLFSFSCKFLRKNLGISAKKLEKLLAFCEKLNLFQLVSVGNRQLSVKNCALFEKKPIENNEDSITIHCPQILEYRDEHTVRQDKKLSSHSGVTPEQTRIEHTQNRTDLEENRTEKNTHTVAVPEFAESACGGEKIEKETKQTEMLLNKGLNDAETLNARDAVSSTAFRTAETKFISEEAAKRCERYATELAAKTADSAVTLVRFDWASGYLSVFKAPEGSHEKVSSHIETIWAEAVSAGLSQRPVVSNPKWFQTAFHRKVLAWQPDVKPSGFGKNKPIEARPSINAVHQGKECGLVEEWGGIRSVKYEFGK